MRARYPRAMTVLLRRSSLGDVVLVGAVAGALPGCTVVTDARYRGLVARMRGVGAVVDWPADARGLPAGPVVDLHGDRRSRALAPQSSGRIDKRTARRFARLWFGVGPKRPSVPELYAEACGVVAVPGPWFDLPDAPREALVLVPGASARTKAWRAAGFVAAGAAWDGPVRVLGGPGDEALVGAIVAGIPGAVGVVEAGFDRTFDALVGVRLAIGGDTGLVHLAGACGIPVVTVFTSTDPFDGFAVHAGRVVARGLACAPCSRHGRDVCPLGDAACRDVPLADVLAAARAVDPGGPWR